MKTKRIQSVPFKFPFFGVSKEDVAAVAVNHRDDMESRYAAEIAEATDKTEIIEGKDYRYIRYAPRFNEMSCELILNRSSEALQLDLEGKTAILNFADYKLAGGRYLDGSVAQEEMLCHDSFLYNVLINRKFWPFFEYNAANLNRGIYADRMLYVPDVIFYDRYKADVISCAGVNMGWARRNTSVDIKEFQGAMIVRIFFIILQAYLHNVDNLVLGAYGCGIFRNDPLIVARSFKIVLNTYFKNCFKRVIFPIPNETIIDIFQNELS